jgi:hypothetical protein
VIGKKKRKITDLPRPPHRPERIRYPISTLFRMFVLGSVAIVGSAWALWRHYTVPHQPMVVPAPSATEIEIEPPP